MPRRLTASRQVASHPRLVVALGVVGACLAFASGTGVRAVAKPLPGGNADSIQHLDYAWRVGHGELPVYEDGIRMPIRTADVYGVAHVQHVANHPPLYYLLLSTVVTTEIDRGNVGGAALRGRAVNITLGIATVLGLAYAGWVFGGSRRNVFAVASATVGASLPQLTQVASDTMNDGLATALGVVAVAVCGRVVISGITRRRVAVLAATCAAGLTTRVAFATVFPVVAVALLASASDALPRIDRTVLRRALPPFGVVCGIGLAASGWFYTRNFALSGSPIRTRTTGSSIVAHRDHASLLEALTSLDVIRLPFTHVFSGRGSVMGPVHWVSLVVVTASLLTGVIWIARTWTPENGRRRRALLTLLVVSMGLTWLSQVQHRWGFGQVHFRYLLPALVPIVLALTAGALSLRRLRAFPLVGIAAFAWFRGLADTADAVANRQSIDADGIAGRLRGAARSNDFPADLVTIGLIGLVVGLAVAAVAMAFLLREDGHGLES